MCYIKKKKLFYPLKEYWKRKKKSQRLRWGQIERVIRAKDPHHPPLDFNQFFHQAGNSIFNRITGITWNRERVCKRRRPANDPRAVSFELNLPPPLCSKRVVYSLEVVTIEFGDLVTCGGWKMQEIAFTDWLHDCFSSSVDRFDIPILSRFRFFETKSLISTLVACTTIYANLLNNKFIGTLCIE